MEVNKSVMMLRSLLLSSRNLAKVAEKMTNFLSLPEFWYVTPLGDILISLSLLEMRFYVVFGKTSKCLLLIES